MNKSFRVVAVLVWVALLAQAATATETLSNPDDLTEQAPEEFAIQFETSKGSFVVDVTRAWSPLGADRFYNLVKNGFYDDVRFFRIVPNFVVQFGMNGNPEISEIWQNARIKDDPVAQSNKAGSLTFAMSGPNSRTTQIFINLKDNARLDEMGFSPFGMVSDGMDVVTALYSDYGDGPPRGRGPNQSQIVLEGNEYLDKNFPELDRIVKATVTRKKSSGDGS
jgi:peptidyl-prolyl cis-trans isomerase A (cyclophilin A)